VVLPLETASMIPRVRPSAIGRARGIAMRFARPLPRRRGAGRRPLSMQTPPPVHYRKPGPLAISANSLDSLHVRIF
jgi:hypothetical protein